MLKLWKFKTHRKYKTLIIGRSYTFQKRECNNYTPKIFDFALPYTYLVQRSLINGLNIELINQLFVFKEKHNWFI